MWPSDGWKLKLEDRENSPRYFALLHMPQTRFPLNSCSRKMLDSRLSGSRKYPEKKMPGGTTKGIFVSKSRHLWRPDFVPSFIADPIQWKHLVVIVIFSGKRCVVPLPGIVHLRRYSKMLDNLGMVSRVALRSRQRRWRRMLAKKHLPSHCSSNNLAS